MSNDVDQQTDPMAELTAMTEVAKALQPLDEHAVRRVLHWAADRFGASIAVATGGPALGSCEINEPAESGELVSVADSFDTVADLYSAASPRNDPEKALVVAYWFQKLCGQADFDSASVNRELKHLGHSVSNITAALSSLIGRKPQLVIQTRKSGSSQQARKKYMLTAEGLNFADRMLSGED